MNENKRQLTQEAYEGFKRELEEINSTLLPDVQKKLEEARGFGDLSENAEYDAAKELNQKLLTRQLELKELLSEVEIININNLDKDIVNVGSTVTIKYVKTGKEETYKIVGEDEVDIFSNKINKKSPLAKAILGKKKDNKTITYEAPKGKIEIIITSIQLV